MENVIHRLTLELARPGSGACITVRRGDSARALVVSLAQSGRPYRISEGVTAVFYARKSDGVPLFNACTVQDNTVRYDFTGQTTNVVGPVACEIRLYDSQMGLLTSAPFAMMVEDTIQQDGDIPDSSPEYTALTEMVSKGTALIESLDGLAEELIPIRDETVQAAADATAAAKRAELAQMTAAMSANHAELMADNAEASAQRAEEAAERAEEYAQVGVTEEKLQEQLAALKADLEYEPIEITEISIEPSVAQMGGQIVNPTISWTVSREPVEQRVGGESVDPSVREHVVEQSFHSDSFVTVQVTDERGAEASKSAGMNFYNAVYYTDHWTGQEPPTDAELRAMTTRLQAGRGVTINAEAGDGEYVLYACPSRMGTPEFWANGFQGGFNWRGVAAHINACGYREDYDIWVSGAAGLNITITVK